MTKEQLQKRMTQLMNELHNPIVSNTPANEKQIIAKAVQLGMQYREEMIKEGINIVFNSLYDKNISK